MTTGPPLYLVSACSSAEEFVAAFRRYADRTGLFVPSAQPLPAGRRGRLAITLRDGGVMIEGEAEILQSSAKPTVLHGRPGMTVKFVEPDEPSKLVIGELEKARLAMKPPPSTVPPRPADVPAAPRPVPPTPGGRIDAANALAECVVIGDVSSLKETATAPKNAAADKSGSRFVVPSIPPAGTPRPKTPSTPPELQGTRPGPPISDRPKTPTAPPNPSATAVPAPPPGGPRPAVQPRMTSIGFPAVDKLPAKTESSGIAAPRAESSGIAAPKAESSGIAAPRAEPGRVGTSASPSEPSRVPAQAPKLESGRVAAPAPRLESGRVAAPAPKLESGRVAAGAPKLESGRVAAPAPKLESGRVAAPAPKLESGRVAAPAPKLDSGGVAASKPQPGAGASAPTPESDRVAASAAKPDSGRLVSNATTLGMPALDRRPSETTTNTASARAAANAALESKIGVATRGDQTPPRFFHTATVPGAAPVPPGAAPNVSGPDEATTIGQGPPKPPVDLDRASPATSHVIIEDEATTIGEVPKKTTDPMPTAVPTGNGPRADAKLDKKTSIGFPVVRSPFETQPLGLVPPAAPSGPVQQSPATPPKSPEVPTEPAPPTLPKTARAPAPARTKSPTTPPKAPRHPTPASPLPIVRMPAKPAPIFGADDEKTDLGQAPMAAAVPVEPAATPGSGGTPRAEQRAQRSGGMRASEIMAAIPSGDWTMSPDESVPHALPAEAKVPVQPPSEATPAPGAPPKGPPTGDWTISLDPETGWSEPAKVPKGASPSPASGNPVVAVASDKPISVVQWDEKPTGIGESKIEVDSTLMEPLKQMPDLDSTAPLAAIPDTTAPQNPLADGAAPPIAQTARPSSGYAGNAQYMAGAAAPMTPYPVQSQAALDRMGFGGPPIVHPQAPAKRKKMIIMAIAAGLVAVGAIVMLVLTLGEKKASQAAVQPGSASEPAKVVVPAKPTPPGEQPMGSGSEQAAAPGSATHEAVPPHPGSAATPAGSGSQQAAVQPPGETKPAPDKPAAGGTCKVQVASVPTGADVIVGDKKLGTTPAAFELPCGSESKLLLKKRPYGNTLRAFTPDAGKPNKLVVKLNKTLLSVKVTSTPAGATITAGGKSMGVTPTTIKLPAGETSSITLTKPGFAADTQKLTPKQNNSSHHVTLKKGKSASDSRR